MIDLSLKDIEFIKIRANSDSTILQAGMNEAIRCRLDAKIGMILREYYKENTMNAKTGWDLQNLIGSDKLLMIDARPFRVDDDTIGKEDSLYR